MKKLLLILLGLSLMALLFAGCGDDETTTAPTRARAALFATGFAYLDSVTISLKSRVFFLNINASDKRVDSANLSGTPVLINTDMYAFVYGDGGHSWTYGDTSDQRFQAGDTVDINIFFQNTLSKCSVKLLTYNSSPNVFIPTNNDTSNLGVPINFVFNSVPDADWYGIRHRYYHDSAGTNINEYKYWAQEDTAFTISGIDLLQNGYQDVDIISGTGPLPSGTDIDNISGDLIDGAIYSYTTRTKTRTYIGTGTPDSPNAPANDEIDNPDDIAEQIMFELTGIKPPPNRGSTTNRPIN